MRRRGGRRTHIRGGRARCHNARRHTNHKHYIMLTHTGSTSKSNLPFCVTVRQLPRFGERTANTRTSFLCHTAKPACIEATQSRSQRKHEFAQPCTCAAVTTPPARHADGAVVSHEQSRWILVRGPESSAVPAVDMETMLPPRPAQLTAAVTCRLAKRTSLGREARRQREGFAQAHSQRNELQGLTPRIKRQPLA